MAPGAPELATGTDRSMTDRERLLDDLRPVAFAIAYRMLGSVSEAEDVVQEALLLHDVFDYDYAEIATIVGKSQDNVRQHAARARATSSSVGRASNLGSPQRRRRRVGAPRRGQRRPRSALPRRAGARDRRLGAPNRRRPDRGHQRDRQPRQARTPRAGRRPPIADEVGEMTSSAFARAAGDPPGRERLSAGTEKRTSR